ncbi:MAG: cation-translocating P-type ATPase, partial [Clostridia bacterium]|nr:cation-translocating P-type ATPase [Clostridia bacterium]
MIQKWIHKLTDVPATVISGVFLLAGLVLPWVLHRDLPLWGNPVWVTLVISGTPLLVSAVRKLIRNRGIAKISSALLVSTAMIAAVIIGDLFAAGEVAFIMAVGEILEDKTTERAKKGLKKLMTLTPTQGRKLVDGEEQMVAAELLGVGDTVRILPGETIPVDGRILKGETTVDQSIMTGESLPVDKTIGDEVFCGTVNRFGSIDIQATKVGEDSSLQKLIRMVKDAEEKQAPMQRTADRWASILVPVAFLLAVVAGWIRMDVTTAVTVLVVFCPCALVLATPTAIMAAVGQATKHGVIIKSGEALEKMGRADVVAIDKTGTLTEGTPGVCEILPLRDGVDEEQLLILAASAETKSEHPLGRAIVCCAKERGLSFLACDDFFMEAGKGIRATVGEKTVLCGNESYLAEREVCFDGRSAEHLHRLGEEGKAIVAVADDNGLLGLIALSDRLRSACVDTVERLHRQGVRTVLLTGDNPKTANYVAKQVGVSEVRGGLLPGDKVACLEELRREGH